MFSDYFSYVIASSTTTPDYNHLRSLFRNYLTKQGLKEDRIFDWNKKEQSLPASKPPLPIVRTQSVSPDIKKRITTLAQSSAPAKKKIKKAPKLPQQAPLRRPIKA